MGQTFTVAAALAAASSSSLPADAEIVDTAFDVASNLDALQLLAHAGDIASISLLNPGRPDLPITETQLTGDAAALALIDTPYQPARIITAAEAATAVLAPGFTSFEVVDTAANLLASLPAVEALWKTGALSGTRLTDSGAPVLKLTAAQVAAGADVLQQIATAHTIVLTDGGTPTITLTPYGTYTNIFTNVLARITTPYALAASVPLRPAVLAGDQDGVDRFANEDTPLPAAATASGPAPDPSVLPNGLTVIDWQENITGYLDSLEAAAAAGKITSILVRDSGPIVLSITAAQLTADHDAIALLSPNYALSEIITAAQASTATLATLPTGFAAYTVQVTAANIVANLDGIEALARTGLLTRVNPTQAGATFTLSAAALGRDAPVLSYAAASNYTAAFVLTDPGTPTVTVSADVFSTANVRTYVLNAIVGPYSLAVTGAVTFSVAAAVANENSSVLTSLAAPLNVIDYSGNLSASLPGLEALAATGKLGTISLRDGGGLPVLGLTAAQQTAAAAVLTHIVSPYVVSTIVSATAATIAGELGALETQAEAGTLGAITLTNGGTPVLSISAATLSADALALSHISSAYSITLTDGGTPTIALHEWQVAEGVVSLILGKITSPYTLTIDDAVTAYQTGLLGSVSSHLGSSVVVNDYTGAFENNIASLETLATAGKIASISLTNGAGTSLPITAAQYASSAAVLALVTTPYTLSLSVSAAAAASTARPAGFSSFAVVDTTGNVLANLGSLQTLAAEGLLSSIALTGPAVLSLSAAVLTANILALARINQTDSIVLTDTGTPTITLAAEDLNDYQIVDYVLSRITSPFHLAVTGVIGSYSTATILNAGGAVLSSLVTPLTVLDYSGSVVPNLPRLETLAQDGLLSAINLTDGTVADLGLTSAQVSIDADALARIASPFTTGATTRSPVSDTAANVEANLASLEASAAAGTLGTINLTDAGTPTLALAASTLLTDWLALAAIVSNYTISLIDTGTPSLALTVAQSSDGAFLNVLSRISSPFTITISGTLGTYDARTFATSGLIGNLIGDLSVADFANNVSATLDSLQILASVGVLGSVVLLDGPGAPITVTASQAVADAGALAAIATPHTLSLVVSAAQAATTTLPSGFLSLSVSDTAANVVANLAALQTISGELAQILLVGPIVVDVSAAQFSTYAFLLSKLENYQYSIHLTDAGTPVITLPVQTIENYNVLHTLLPAIDGSYSLDVTGAISSYQVAQIVAAPPSVLSALTTPIAVLDGAQAIVTNIAALQAVATQSLLGSIELNDGSVPTLNLTPAQATADAAVLAKIVGPYLLPTANQTASGSAAGILAELDTLEAQAFAGTLKSITLTDGATPVLSLTAAQFAADALALSLIVSPVTVKLTDTGTPTVTLTAAEITVYGIVALLDKVTSPYKLTVDGAIGSYPATNFALNGPVAALTAPIEIVDYSGNVAFNLGSLEALATAGKLGTIQLTDGGIPALFVTPAEAIAGQAALAAISSFYTLSLTVTAAASATTVLSGSATTLNVTDTQANIVANLASLEQQALTGRLVSITITDHNALTLSAATAEANLDALGRITGNPSITLTDSGTPAITIAEWQVDNANLAALSQITGPFTLTVTDPVRPVNAVRFASVDGGALVSHLASDSLVIRDGQANFFTSNLSELETLLPKIASIDLRTSQAIINFTTTEATADSGLLAKIIDPYLLAQDITVAQIGTPLAAGFSGYAIVDTAAHITAGLAQIETLALDHRLLSIEPTDAAPIFTLSAAIISADADALDAQNINSYPVILTDTGTPTITLQSYQLNYSMLNNILGAISGPFHLDIVGRIGANPASMLVVENPSVLANLVTPLDVSDDAGYISTDLDELEALAKLGKLHSVLVLDGATTPITVASTQQEAADHDALALFTTPPSLQVTCFLAGTRIATEGGEVAVEDLRIGDRVITRDDGRAAPIRWIGRRRLDARSHPRPDMIQPIRISRDAFANGAPHRDLLISPDHAIYIDGLLVPARLLVNGATIRQDRTITDITYLHIELDRHAVLFSEGLPTESYLDTGNRGLFENGHAPLTLHPDLTGAHGQAARESLSCAPFAADAARVEPLWRRLAARAVDLGHTLPAPATTSDPALRIRAGGRDHGPIAVTAGRYIFAVPRSAATVRLVSRASVPCDISPWIDDRRRLGVWVGRIVMSGPAGVVEMPVDHPAHVAGWHPMEWWTLSRWTDGDAVLPIPPGTRLLEVHLARETKYAVGTGADDPAPIGARGERLPGRRAA